MIKSLRNVIEELNCAEIDFWCKRYQLIRLETRNYSSFLGIVYRVSCLYFSESVKFLFPSLIKAQLFPSKYANYFLEIVCIILKNGCYFWIKRLVLRNVSPMKFLEFLWNALKKGVKEILSASLLQCWFQTRWQIYMEQIPNLKSLSWLVKFLQWWLSI